ncbi:MAG TPA: pyridoxamine 5'-phosphate oxidase family protein [Candidatus Limnocylindrales bacterium]|nr:pyridoxamine 5'-phosphate oxidase family protein [Candidatus Limnocylindrales bacterium]
MADERTPERETSLLNDQSKTTSWEMARERLANPEQPRTCWLATTSPDGRPHLMPVIAFWIDDAMHMVVGEGSRKARNLAANSQCVLATSSTTLPSLDIVIEGTAEPLTDEGAVRDIAAFLNSNNWPLEAKGDKVWGPNAPTAGPPPYAIFRLVPAKVFGLPGMLGMDQFKPEELPKPTRWDFSRS